MDTKTAIEWLRRDVTAISNESTDPNGLVLVSLDALRIALDHIAALGADNAELRFVRESAEDEIIAGREYLNIAGKEIPAT